MERIERGRREWGETELGRLTTIFAHSSKASPEGPQERRPVVGCGLYEAEFPEENVSSLAHTVKTGKRKMKNSSLDEIQKAGTRIKCKTRENHW